MDSFAGSESKAAFGDSYGALNTLFSGLAFAGIIVSIFLQSKELRDTRKEMKSQGNQFDLQTQAMNTQLFESKFFQLLNLHTGKVKTVRNRSTRVIGEEAFQKLFEDHLNTSAILTTKFDNEYTLSQLSKGTEKFYEDNKSNFGSYFSNLFLIIEYIDNSTVVDKSYYVKLIKAQLSSYELAHIFFFVASESEKKGVKQLLEKYSFFEDLHLDLIIRGKYLNYYELVAYGDNKSL